MAGSWVRGSTRLRSGAALAGWIGLIAVARWRGLVVIHEEPRAALSFPPLAVRFDPRIEVAFALPVALGIAAVVWGPRVAGRLPWRPLLAAAFLAAAVWAIALAAPDGVAGLTGDTNYLDTVTRVGSPGEFLRTLVQRIDGYPQHVRAHPPGMVLLLWTLARIGLAGRGWEGILVALAGASVVPAAMIALRETADEDSARRAAAFLAFGPMAIWVATTADALYAGVAAWAVALMVLSIHRPGRRADLLAAAGGLLFGAGLFLSYGLVPMVLLPASVAAGRRRVRPLLLAAIGVVVVALAFRWAGFWWFDGLHATIREYNESAARFRPLSEFWLIDLGAFAVALGPASFVGLARLRDRRVWMLVGAALVAMALADFSGLSRGETERIWLSFAPWILLATTALADREREARAWLILQVGVALLLQSLIRGP